MRRNKILMIFYLVSLCLFSTLALQFIHQKYYSEVETTTLIQIQQFKDVTIYGVVNQSTILEGEPFTLHTIIVNPTSYELANLSFYILAPPTTKVVTATNLTGVQTIVRETVENVNISIRIEKIPRESTFVHNTTLEIDKSGEETLDYSSASLKIVKGEYVNDATVTIPDKRITIKSQTKKPPEEGKISQPELIIFGVIILPLVAFTISPKLTPKDTRTYFGRSSRPLVTYAISSKAGGEKSKS